MENDQRKTEDIGGGCGQERDDHGRFQAHHRETAKENNANDEEQPQGHGDHHPVGRMLSEFARIAIAVEFEGVGVDPIIYFLHLLLLGI